MNIYSKITRINTYTSSTLLEKCSPKGILTGYSCQGSDFFFFVPCSWHVDHIISHFFTELKIYDGSLVLKILQNFPKLLEIKMTATCQLKRFVHVFVAVYFFQVLILVNGNLSVLLALGYSYRTLYIFFLLKDRNLEEWEKWLFSEEDSLAGSNDQF